MMSGKLHDIVNDSQALNSKLISMPRLLILLALEPGLDDGSQYRELKSSLQLEEGVLFSNLKILESMGYVRKKEETVEKKTITTYVITESGKIELDKIRKWFGDWNKIGDDSNEK